MKQLGLYIIFTLVFIPLIACAAVPKWRIIPNESTISFVATQNDAPISGKFTRFSGEITFDPDQLSQSKARIIVDTGSIATSYDELTSTLVLSDWFDVSDFPQAVYETTQFKRIRENQYQADGKLTIKNQTTPVTIYFQQISANNGKVRIKGQAQLKRLAFNIGAGEWSDTNEIKDDVQVNFLLTAVKQ